MGKEWVMRMLNFADGTDSEVNGKLLKTYDADAFGGKGVAIFTVELRDAMRFSSPTEGMALWRTRSKVRPNRGDGKPNRPLTKIMIDMVPVTSMMAMATEMVPDETHPFDGIIFQVNEPGSFPPFDEPARNLAALAKQHPRVVLCPVVAGFDDDPRELFEIPEVYEWLCNFCKALSQHMDMDEFFARVSDTVRPLYMLCAGRIKPHELIINKPEAQETFH